MSPTASSTARKELSDAAVPVPPPRTTSSANNKPSIKPASVITSVKPTPKTTDSKPKSTKTSPAPKTPATPSTPVVERAKSASVTKSTAPSPLTRHGSLRLPQRSANKLVYHEDPAPDKESLKPDSKSKSLMSRIGSSKVKPESSAKSSKSDSPRGALPTVVEQTGEESITTNSKGSIIKRIVGKTTPKKSVEKTSAKKTTKK
mmetsp:Transcript_19091/g.31820  ORF Transcript_19091/g.31820 Transcript_19091/m.31820 type:complete len:203 (-) Transcript_19091:533-1141(-)